MIKLPQINMQVKKKQQRRNSKEETAKKLK